MRGYGSNDYRYSSTYFDRSMKRSRVNFEKKTPGYLYLPISQFFPSKINLELMSCLHNAVVNSVTHIEKNINKCELYRQFTPMRVNNTTINDIDNASCVSSVMKHCLYLK